MYMLGRRSVVINAHISSMCRLIRCHIKEKKVVKSISKSKWKPDIVTYQGEKA